MNELGCHNYRCAPANCRNKPSSLHRLIPQTLVGAMSDSLSLHLALYLVPYLNPTDIARTRRVCKVCIDLILLQYRLLVYCPSADTAQRPGIISSPPAHLLRLPSVSTSLSVVRFALRPTPSIIPSSIASQSGTPPSSLVFRNRSCEFQSQSPAALATHMCGPFPRIYLSSSLRTSPALP